ncbi:hypothetical protein O3Q52_01805 [Streptomyces sp. ActVer]|uniref:hypothetical protein n=1 Tax=Streptomyces sp. ActVer TaxID=3014558 RepID=UPI0022B30933|nr:hypothetical protein [Streptomyces sp. ActVer]MCZ4506963.1 hypothetical protein [Streptomyces sp. ActVer]
MDRPAFDPALHDGVARAQGFIPAAADGLTHFLGSREGSRGREAAAECGSSEGTRLSANWSLVDCLECRGGETPVTAEFVEGEYRLSTRPRVVGGGS